MTESVRAEPEPLSPEEDDFFRVFARTLVAVPRALDADLRREQDLTMSEYSAMMYLSEAPGRWLRMSELATAHALSPSGMTRVVQRLEKQGWVRRERSTDDGRGANAVLTDAGLARLEEAWPTHLASVRRHVIAHLDGLDVPRITAALREFGEGAGDGDHGDHDDRPTPDDEGAGTG